MEFFLLVFQSYKKVVAEEVDNYCKKYITKEDSKPSLAELCEVKMRNGNTEATDKVKSIAKEAKSKVINKEEEDNEDCWLLDEEDEEQFKSKKFGGTIPDEVKESGKLLKLRYRLKGWSHIPIISLASLCTCSECGEQFKDHSSNQEHWNTVHQGKEFTYKCIEEEETCHYSTQSLRHMKDHIRQHMVDMGYMAPCKICSKLFHRKHMVNHLRTHNSSRQFECNLCGKAFKNSGALKTHMKTHLPEDEQDVYPCDICGKKITTKAGLKVHIQAVHLNEREFECDMCDLKFLTACQLKYHQTAHSDDRPFLCDQCDASFKRKKALREHIMSTHEGTFRFNCPHCDARYNNKQLFDGHVRSHTGEKPFNCSICGKGFSKARTMRNHERIHLPEEEKYIYPCEICGKRFSVKGHLKTHMKGVHSINN